MNDSWLARESRKQRWALVEPVVMQFSLLEFGLLLEN